MDVVATNCLPQINLKDNQVGGTFIFVGMLFITIQNVIETSTITRRLTKHPDFRFPVYIIVCRFMLIISSIIGSGFMIRFSNTAIQANPNNPVAKTMRLINILVLVVNIISMVLFSIQVHIYAIKKRIQTDFV